MRTRRTCPPTLSTSSGQRRRGRGELSACLLSVLGSELQVSLHVCKQQLVVARSIKSVKLTVFYCQCSCSIVVYSSLILIREKDRLFENARFLFTLAWGVTVNVILCWSEQKKYICANRICLKSTFNADLVVQEQILMFWFRCILNCRIYSGWIYSSAGCRPRLLPSPVVRTAKASAMLFWRRWRNPNEPDSKNCGSLF